MASSGSNDLHGHAVGDALLVAVAKRLAAVVRPADTVGRFGGDEFLVLCADLAAEDEALAIAHRIREALRQPFDLDGLVVRIAGSVGIATYDERVAGAARLIHNADLAMYRAKKGGKDDVVHFTSAIAEGVASGAGSPAPAR
jgi:diguanylate cyclase (GGDEF)-like protein